MSYLSLVVKENGTTRSTGASLDTVLLLVGDGAQSARQSAEFVSKVILVLAKTAKIDPEAILDRVTLPAIR